MLWCVQDQITRVMYIVAQHSFSISAVHLFPVTFPHNHLRCWERDGPGHSPSTPPGPVSLCLSRCSVVSPFPPSPSTLCPVTCRELLMTPRQRWRGESWWADSVARRSRRPGSPTLSFQTAGFSQYSGEHLDGRLGRKCNTTVQYKPHGRRDFGGFNVCSKVLSSFCHLLGKVWFSLQLSFRSSGCTKDQWQEVITAHNEIYLQRGFSNDKNRSIPLIQYEHSWQVFFFSLTECNSCNLPIKREKKKKQPWPPNVGA